MKRRVFLLAPVALLAGCASVAPFTGVRLHDDALWVSDVPPVRQDPTHACGAACVAAVAAHWGVGLAEFRAAIPQAPNDANADELVAMAQRLGLQAFSYEGSLDDLRENLATGRPVIVMIPLPLAPRGGLVTSALFAAWNEIGPRPPHWVTVVGLFGADRVLINDPASGPLLLDRAAFLTWWARERNICVLIAKTDGPAVATVFHSSAATP
jgi:ABC-type bacteriocin/lantibiotic exporter with double-glycine peptidase domain